MATATNDKNKILSGSGADLDRMWADMTTKDELAQLPNSLKLYLALEIAERALQAQQLRSRDMDERFFAALHALRQGLLLGRVPDLEKHRVGVDQAVEDTQWVSGGAGEWADYERAGQAVQAAISVLPNFALCQAAHLLFWDQEQAQPNAEQLRWGVSRLSWLKEVWTTCGERSPWLLAEDLAPFEWDYTTPSLAA